MQVVESISDVRRIRRGLPGSWGLVPTMGFLHAGHLALAERARAENDHVGASIFVNPTQFNSNEDLANYPRNLPGDMPTSWRARRRGCPLFFAPEPEEIYPPGGQTFVESGGAFGQKGSRGRAGRGISAGSPPWSPSCSTIVEPLARPLNRAEGRAAGARHQIAWCGPDVQASRCSCFPTKREEDGVAMSSRNTYLTPEQRAAAPVLYRALCAARDAWQAGEHDGERLRQIMRGVLAAEPLARPDYVSAADPFTLAELGDASRGVLLSMAVRVGKARLIDNIRLIPDS